MLGFDPLTLSAAYILASMTTAQCPAPGPVTADVEFVRNDAPYITDLSAAQLTRQFGNDPDSTLATDGKWMVSGVTVVSKSGIAGEWSAQFQQVTTVKTGAACFAVSSVKYTIVYSPQVYIASDYKNMGCRYSATAMHEKRHVDADQQTITDFIPDMKKAIEKYAPTIGAQGPYEVGDVDNQKKRIIQMMSDALEPQWEELLALRRQRQAQIDTIQNYMRDTALCPGQFPKFDGSQ